MLLRRRDQAAAPVRVVRVFRFGAQQWLDPDPALTPEQVRDLLAEQVPQLTTCAIDITEEPNAQVHTFQAPAGKRGSAQPTTKQTVTFTPNQGKRG